MSNTAHLGLPFIEGAQAQKHITHNEALRILDAAIQIAVADVTRAAPPTGPDEGQRHIVAASPTGAWAGHADAIATYEDGAWRFLTPKTGWCAWSADDEVVFVFDGGAWRDLRDLPVTLDDVVHLGINTTASSPNLLSVRSNAALLAAINAADGGSGEVRLQLSRENAAKTSSVVFSNAYWGRAEFGLIGSDAFKLKVSPDGASWIEAFSIDSATGLLSLPRGAALAAVLSPAQITANQNDYAPAGHAAATMLRIYSDAARTLTGLAGGGDGIVKMILNVGAYPITLADADTGSVAANRLALCAATTLLAGQAALLWYDATASRWRLIASNAHPQLTDGGIAAIKLDANSAAKQKDFRAAIAAAPLDALAFTGLQTNGAMEVSQENVGNAVTLTATGSLQTRLSLDGAAMNYCGAFVATAQQVFDGPPGFHASLKIAVTTAQTTLGASDELSVSFLIEGLRSARLAAGTSQAVPISIGFWVKAHRIGVYSGSLRNAAKSRSHPFAFNINVADVWEYKTVTIAGDTSGTWLIGSGIGMNVSFCVAGGSSRLGTAAAWAAADCSGAASSTNGVAATTDIFQITGLMIVPGAELPASDRSGFTMRTFDQELPLCQRYYEKSFSTSVMPVQNSGDLNGAAWAQALAASAAVTWNVNFNTVKRATPTMTSYNPQATNAQARNPGTTDYSSTQFFNTGTHGFRLYALAPASGVGLGSDCAVHWTADARL